MIIRLLILRADLKPEFLIAHVLVSQAYPIDWTLSGIWDGVFAVNSPVLAFYRSFFGKRTCPKSLFCKSLCFFSPALLPPLLKPQFGKSNYNTEWWYINQAALTCASYLWSSFATTGIKTHLLLFRSSCGSSICGQAIHSIFFASGARSFSRILGAPTIMLAICLSI